MEPAALPANRLPPEATANGVFRYDAHIDGVGLRDAATGAYRALAAASGWSALPPRPGQFGFDNLISSVGHALGSWPEGGDVDRVAALVHDGWVRNYRYWRDVQPWALGLGYRAPAAPLGDLRRETCALAAFADLPPDEQEKDRIVARHVLELRRSVAG